MSISLRADGSGQFRVAAPFIRNATHAARQFLGGEESGPKSVRCDDELDRGEPMGIEHDHGVIVERLELLGTNLMQCWYERDFLSLVQRQSLVTWKHDRGDM